MTKPVFSPSAMAGFSALYPEKRGVFSHDLLDHPLLSIESLVGLGQRLNPAHVEYNRAELPIGVDPAAVESNGLSIAETIRSIEENGSWMVLKWIENDPAYKTLLSDVLGELRHLIEPVTGKMLTLEGFIFVSSPNAVTPYHMDPEHNILLQVRGSKTFTVFPQDDQQILSDVEHERYHMGGHRNLPWRDDFSAKGIGFAMKPGDAIHVPVKAPHWIKVGPELSVSLSVTWRSEWSYREADARGFNHVVRRYGLNPSAPGRFPAQNHAKAFGFRAIRRLGIGI
jgi:hypothetical protein